MDLEIRDGRVFLNISDTEVSADETENSSQGLLV